MSFLDLDGIALANYASACNCLTHTEHSSTLIPDPTETSNAATVWLSVTGPDQALMKPLREIFVTQFTACDSCDGLRDYLVALDEFIAASLHQRFHQIESRSFVTIRKSAI